MANKLRVSKQTQQIFSKVGSANGLQPFALAKLAIALSIRKGVLVDTDYGTDNEGQELNRQTIFGDHDLIFKCLFYRLLGILYVLYVVYGNARDVLGSLEGCEHFAYLDRPTAVVYVTSVGRGLSYLTG